MNGELVVAQGNLSFYHIYLNNSKVTRRNRRSQAALPSCEIGDLQLMSGYKRAVVYLSG